MGFSVDKDGFYGGFGGAFIPEMMYKNISMLRESYLPVLEEEGFMSEYSRMLADYAGRPSPLYFARRLSDHFGIQVWLKREDLNHTGAHKINNTIGQILIARRLGKKRIIAETGAGQHGVATATVCALTGMKCVVYMGKTDVERQAPNVMRMRMLGAEVIPVLSGSMTLKDATNEAIRDWINNPSDTYYLIGSVVGPHPYPDLVARLQSVISSELIWQLPKAIGRSAPDYLVACVGGGSNAAGTFYHYLDNSEVRLVAVEAAGKGVDSGETAATIKKGSPGVIHGSMTMLMQDEDGQITEPYSVSAGLDYPGIGPLFAHLNSTGRASFMDATDKEALEAALLLARLEGIIPALEPAHALAVLGRLGAAKNDVVVLTLSGRGDKDMDTYIGYMEEDNK